MCIHMYMYIYIYIYTYIGRHDGHHEVRLQRPERGRHKNLYIKMCVYMLYIYIYYV